MVPAYRFKVKKGFRLADIGLKLHIPSHMKIEGLSPNIL